MLILKQMFGFAPHQGQKTKHLLRFQGADGTLKPQQIFIMRIAEIYSLLYLVLTCLKLMPNESSDQGNLLIVDDLADNLRVLSNTLSQQSYRVRCVKSGAMALVGAKAILPDLILLDIRMPEMDGYEVCRQLKADPETADIPIIFLSALDETMDKARAFEVGGADYITKPFQVEEVLARVKNQLTIQHLKKQVVEQRQQMEQLVGRLSGARNPAPGSEFQQKAMTAIAAILDCSDRLSQYSALDAEQHAALRAISQNGQTLLNLINSQPV